MIDIQSKKVCSASNCVLGTLCKLDQGIQEQPEVLLYSSKALKIAMTWVNLQMPSNCVFTTSVNYLHWWKAAPHFYTYLHILLSLIVFVVSQWMSGIVIKVIQRALHSLSFRDVEYRLLRITERVFFSFHVQHLALKQIPWDI